jgi:hypothetical protein
MQSAISNGSPAAPTPKAHRAPGAAARFLSESHAAVCAASDPACLVSLLVALVLGVQTLAITSRVAVAPPPPPPPTCADAERTLDESAPWWASPLCVVYQGAPAAGTTPTPAA